MKKPIISHTPPVWWTIEPRPLNSSTRHCDDAHAKRIKRSLSRSNDIKSWTQYIKFDTNIPTCLFLVSKTTNWYLCKKKTSLWVHVGMWPWSCIFWLTTLLFSPFRTHTKHSLNSHRVTWKSDSRIECSIKIRRVTEIKEMILWVQTFLQPVYSYWFFLNI